MCLILMILLEQTCLSGLTSTIYNWGKPQLLSFTTKWCKRQRYRSKQDINILEAVEASHLVSDLSKFITCKFFKRTYLVSVCSHLEKVIFKPIKIVISSFFHRLRVQYQEHWIHLVFQTKSFPNRVELLALWTETSILNNFDISCHNSLKDHDKDLGFICRFIPQFEQWEFDKAIENNQKE